MGQGSEGHGGIEKKKGGNYGHGKQCGDCVVEGDCEGEDGLEGVKVMEKLNWKNNIN